MYSERAVNVCVSGRRPDEAVYGVRQAATCECLHESNQRPPHGQQNTHAATRGRAQEEKEVKYACLVSSLSVICGCAVGLSALECLLVASSLASAGGVRSRVKIVVYF